MSLHGLHTQLNRLWPHRGRRPYPERMRVPFYGGGEIILFSHSSIPRGTPDAEYDLRFDADEEYVRELIDRIDEMSFREVKLCSRCTAKHAGEWQAKPGRAQCA